MRDRGVDPVRLLLSQVLPRLRAGLGQRLASSAGQGWAPSPAAAFTMTSRPRAATTSPLATSNE